MGASKNISQSITSRSLRDETDQLSLFSCFATPFSANAVPAQRLINGLLHTTATQIKNRSK